MKEFKAESKKLMDLMINSIYTNKEIFLRELISNASDAIDKLYYKSLIDRNIKINNKNLEINISIDKKNKTLNIKDNGCGMTKNELEENLGTIAKSGSLEFKENNDKKKNIDIIGQFGVGFYSAFMVSDKVEVISKAYNSEEANKWISTGTEGYKIEKADKKEYGTEIILYIKENTDDEKYDEYLEEHTIKHLIKKYSDYITYPIKINNETINTLTPIWKRDKKKIKEEEYNTFYSDKFFDYEKPLEKIHTTVEGMVSYDALMYIPSHTSFDYYSKDYEKGLQLYSNGVLIMEKCSDLLPDYFSFIKGIVDTPDLSLNISREILQQTNTLKIIATNIEKKIKSTLENMIKNERAKYEEFFKAFGNQIKFGIYNNFGLDKEKLMDLLLFYSSKEKKNITLKEYVENMKEKQDKIYYVCGETIEKIDLLPQVESIKEKDYEILYLTDYADEFVMKTLVTYNNLNLINISTSEVDLSNEDEKKEIELENKNNNDLLNLIKETIKTISEVKFTNKLKNHPVCLSTKGDVSIEMEKIINAMPTDEKINAETVLEININHPIANKLKELYKKDQEMFKNYSLILYNQAKLIEGLTEDNPTEISKMICDILSK